MCFHCNTNGHYANMCPQKRGGLGVISSIVNPQNLFCGGQGPKDSMLQPRGKVNKAINNLEE
jgi:hypothetical protein